MGGLCDVPRHWFTWSPKDEWEMTSFFIQQSKRVSVYLNAERKRESAEAQDLQSCAKSPSVWSTAWVHVCEAWPGRQGDPGPAVSWPDLKRRRRRRRAVGCGLSPGLLPSQPQPLPLPLHIAQWPLLCWNFTLLDTRPGFLCSHNVQAVEHAAGETRSAS